jgi:hypothetical protein
MMHCLAAEANKGAGNDSEIATHHPDEIRTSFVSAIQ